ncbi:MAG: ABC transporter permease subunit [Acidimicrobiia bacterium]
MFHSVFTKAIWDRRVSLAGWTLGTAAITLVVVAVYPLLAASPDMQDIISDLPPGVLGVLGFDPETFLTGAGFLQGELYSLIGPVMVIGLGASAAAGATAREEQEGTMDTLLAMPISRTSILLHKSSVVALSVAVVPATMGLVMVATNPLFDLELGIRGIVAANLGLAGLGLVFAGFALAVGAFSGSVPMTTGTTLLVAVAAWFASAFRGIFGWLDVPAKVSPFSWYSDNLPLLNGVPVSFVWLVAVTAGFVVSAVMLFQRRDIATALTLLPRRSSVGARQATRSPRSAWLLSSVFGKTIWDRRRSLWTWAFGLSALLVLTIAAWPVIAADADAMQGLITAMPKELFALLGITDPALVATPEGFVSSRAYQTIGPVVMILFCVGTVASIVVREERSGTLDLVLSHPLRRSRVLYGKALAIAVMAFVIGVVLMVSGLVGSALWNMGLSPVHVLAANAGLVLLALFFGGLSLAVWSLLPSGGSAGGITAGIAVGAFLLNGLGSLVDVLEPFRPLSPFFWYLGDMPPLAHGFSFGYLVLGIGASVAVVVAALRFERRDLAV